MDQQIRIPVVVAGVTGKTGSAVGRGIQAAPDMDLVGALSLRHAGESLGSLWSDPNVHIQMTASLDEIDQSYAVLVDFTEPESALDRLFQAVDRHWDIVVGTTGFSKEARDMLAERVERVGVGAAVIANFSLGAWVAQRLAQEASRYFEAVEVVEGHHAGKKDRPSGTAKVMAGVLGEAMKRPADSIPVHSLRLPGMVAHQAVIFGSQGQMLSIRHDVHDRTAYVDGVLATVRQVNSLGGRVISDLGQVLDPSTHPCDPA